MRYFPMLFLILSCLCSSVAFGAEPAPLEPFKPDEHTLLLYHFDEGQGPTAKNSSAKDSSGHAYDGQLQGACWAAGKFGRAVKFDGKDDSVYCKTSEAIGNLKQITVECWFNQRNPAGRQFLVGKDVTFHFDINGGYSTSTSLYNKSGAKNVEGLQHQHLGTPLGSGRFGRWHHIAFTYDGSRLSWFLDGVLVGRLPAAKDFTLGGASRGFWVGCYIGQDYWFSGRIDEVRVSDCIRYDSENKLKKGQRAFDVPGMAPITKSVRKPKKTGTGKLRLALKKLYGDSAAGWVYLKRPGTKAVIVGRYDLAKTENGAELQVECDVSDELIGDGQYIVGLEGTKTAGYFALVRASLVAGEKTLAQWSGEKKSRRTFKPPILVPLQVGNRPAAEKPSRILLLPENIDRFYGNLRVDNESDGATVCLFGDGAAEFWLDVPAEQTYRVHLRYASPSPQPCDIVIDGDDLNHYKMCALGSTASPLPCDALWEYQGIATLGAGLHWIRVEGVLPEIVGIRLEPVAGYKPPVVPWPRHPVPKGDFLGRASSWQVENQFGLPKDSTMTLDSSGGQPKLCFAAGFTNIDKGELSGGDAVRLIHRGAWDLEPFGLLKFRFEGQGSGHVVTVRLIDAKGDEKPLVQFHDDKPGAKEIARKISFEGKDSFDPGRVVAVCIDLDEGNVKPDEVNRFSGAIVGPVFQRRDVVQPPQGYAQSLAKARKAMAARVAQPAEKPAPLRAPRFQPWTKPVVPEEHPLWKSTEPKPVTRKTLGYQLHTTGARGITPETLDRYHKHYDFGDVTWPHIGMCPLRERFGSEESYKAALKEMEKRLIDVRGRGLFVFDIWGYVPFNPKYPCKIAPEHHEILMRVMGDKFLGYDDGEHDGRYIGSYSDRDDFTDRKGGWKAFQKWDDHICNDSMNYMNAVGSLNFSHYYADRNFRMLGLETAQGLPSDTLMFAFLRGAGKQYGRLIHQAASVWSRFGYNVYAARVTKGSRGGNAGYGFGPNKGCSRSLHKRLFFCGYLGGHSVFGTESSQFTADVLDNGAPELSPLGKQHIEMAAWAKKHPDRGVMTTPVAFMLDFYNGWNMPRHLYRGDKYKIWGKLPYEKGDYLIDAVFRTIWPGYEDCSYLRAERGFVTPTPFGDIFDVLTNRCRPEILKQYTAVMLLSDVEMTPQVVDNLGQFVRGGGDLIVSARNARALPAELVGVKFGGPAKGTMSRLLATGKTFDEQPYGYVTLTPAGAAVLVENESGHPLVTVNTAGAGRVIVGAADYWVTDELTYQDPELVNMETPYTILNGIRAVLEPYFDSFNPVEIEPAGLTIRTCCYDGDPKRLLVGLMNNSLFADWQGKLRVRIGPVASAAELWKNRPAALRQPDSVELTIHAGGVAILDIRLK